MINISQLNNASYVSKWINRTGTLRASVMGINDGLVSNFCLVMGLAGGTNNDHQIVLIAAFIGLLAGSLSMAAGEYVSVRAQRDIYEKHVHYALERLKRDHDGERAKLIEAYTIRGLSLTHATTASTILLSNERLALETMLKEEHGLSTEQFGSPWGAAIGSFVAFMLGALVPIAPYMIPLAKDPFEVTILISVLFLALVGATLSALSDKPLWQGALRMLLFGSLAALATYAAGVLINQFV